jgi:hypothetical protein
MSISHEEQRFRSRVFEPSDVSVDFWRRRDVQGALARREIGKLFQLYLECHPACTQTRLAILTEHDRADISNFVRGTRSAVVRDIDVLIRIADGLDMPDEARTLLGLAPAEALASQMASQVGGRLRRAPGAGRKPASELRRGSAVVRVAAVGVIGVCCVGMLDLSKAFSTEGVELVALTYIVTAALVVADAESDLARLVRAGWQLVRRGQGR